jgi:NAD(P)-dependent dehydrogenase (short-subunit alcohol dehydrogenase family)
VSAAEAEELAGQVALVTGAAGEGIGRATARRLLELGAAVAVTDSHERRTKETAESLAREFGARVAGFVLDVGNRDQIAAVCDAVERSLGPVDVLVNNAAINVLVPVSEYPQDDWDRVLEVDLTGCFVLIRRLLPGMKARGRGSIVNVTSIAAFIGNAREGPYAAAKAALHSLTRSVAVEGGPFGVRANAVAPGIIESRFVSRDAARYEALAQQAPLRRIGRAEEVAEAIAFLASERSSYITGEVLNVSGGWYMRA